jgi:hypothetical protein
MLVGLSCVQEYFSIFLHFSQKESCGASFSGIG